MTGQIIDIAQARAGVAAHRRIVNLDEIANRINVALNHPEAAVRRQVREALVQDAAGLLEVAQAALIRLRDREAQLAEVQKALADHAVVVAAFIEQAGGELRVDRAWFDSFAPTGGWTSEQSDTEVVFRSVGDEELATAKAAYEGKE